MPDLLLDPTPLTPAQRRHYLEEYLEDEEPGITLSPGLDDALAGLIHQKGFTLVVAYDRTKVATSAASVALLDPVTSCFPPSRQALEDYLVDENPEALFANDLDEALLGVLRTPGRPTIVIYDLEKVILCHQAWGMDREEAEEFVNFNVIDSYQGTSTPGFLFRPWEN